MLPTLSVALSEIVWMPSFNVNEYESPPVCVHAVLSRLISVNERPLPSPSSTELTKPVRVTDEEVDQPVLEPVETVPMLGPVRSIPMNIVCVAVSPELSYTVNLGFQVPSVKSPEDQSQP